MVPEYIHGMYNEIFELNGRIEFYKGKEKID